MMKEQGSPMLSESAEASPSVFSEHEDDDEEEASTPVIMNVPVRGRRGGVSSESQDATSQEANAKMTFPPKSPETKRQLEVAVKKNVLFSHLEADDRELVFGAMEKVIAKSGETIIKQGDEGDYFYILDSGAAEVWKTFEGNPEPKMVKLVKPLDGFGELALIYNCPRAASVKTTTDSLLWRIDRITYRSVIMGAQIRKRQLYDSFLEKVPILATLQKYERLTVADALQACVFADKDVIIKQGEPGDAFYLIVTGEVVVTKKKEEEGGGELELTRLYSSGYFGEIALLTDRPRAATVRSVGESKCVKLDRDRFTRVMGPCEELLRRNIPLYNQYMSVNIEKRERRKKRRKG